MQIWGIGNEVFVKAQSVRSELLTLSKTVGVYYTGGGARNLRRGGMTLPTRGLKYGFQSVVNAKNLRQNSFSPFDGRLACSDRGL